MQILLDLGTITGDLARSKHSFFFQKKEDSIKP